MTVRENRVKSLLSIAGSQYLHAFSAASACPTLFDPMDYNPSGSLSVESSRQLYWIGLPCSPLGDLPDPRFEPVSLASPALQEASLPSEPQGVSR